MSVLRFRNGMIVHLNVRIEMGFVRSENAKLVQYSVPFSSLKWRNFPIEQIGIH